MKVFNAVRNMKVSKLLLSLSFLLVLSGAQAQPDGEKLFKGNCARCHNVTDKKLVGPGLAGVRQRWSSEDNLIAWITNSADYLKTGDSYATKLYEDYNKAAMPAFTNLSKEEIVSILDYIDNPGTAPGAAPADTTQKASGGAGEAGASNNTLLYILIGVIAILAILIFSLYNISASLIKAIKEREGMPVEDKNLFDRMESSWNSMIHWLKSNKKVTAVIVFLIVLYILKLGWDGLMSVGVYTDYQPHQPIKFSHKLHAGELGVACVYCHTGVSQSKHATIPSPSTCMNCHKAVKEGPTYGKAEIAKIYASIGWDPNKDVFIENYASQPFEEVAKVYETWLGGMNDDYRAVEKFVQKPIDWVQIHKLPDHAYFNHAQHYNVGGIECKNCHGEVEKMEEVYQYSPLTMGWCINCHRETKVQWETNPYYDKLHDYLAERYKKGDQFTISRVGGLECGKCHY